MSNILHGDDLIEKPFDKFWDNPPSRREIQRAFTKIGNNTSELMAMIDTNCLVVNYLCEKLSVTREDLEIYVAKQKAALVAIKEAQEKTQEAQ